MQEVLLEEGTYLETVVPDISKCIKPWVNGRYGGHRQQMSASGPRDEESHISVVTDTRKMHGSEYS